MEHLARGSSPKENVDTSMTEAIVRGDFEMLISCPLMLELPLSVISRLTRIRISKDCFNPFGSPASILFKSFDISKLAFEVCEFEEHDRVFWSAVGGCGGESIWASFRDVSETSGE
jgi:hypothetical protein